MITRVLVFIILLCFSCTTPYDPPANYSTPLLVVNGIITNQPGPYQVSLEFTNINSINSAYRKYPEKAEVTLIDDKGNQEQLINVGKGVFQTSPTGMQGIPGRYYHITITLNDGRNYASEPELLKASPPIAKITSTYIATPADLSSRGHFKTYVETVDSVSPGDYYRWTWINYQYRSFDDLVCGSGACYGILFCEPCWFISRCESCISMQSDRYQNGQKISQFVLNVPYDSKKNYWLEVSQFLITEKAYLFWQNLNAQVNLKGGVFDSPPAAVPGNIKNVQDSNEQVLGFFSAAGLSKKMIYVARDYIPLAPINNLLYVHFADYCKECPQDYFFTPQRPENWDDSLNKDCLNCPG